MSSIAHELAKKQKEISVSEFFEKNKQILGFDSLTRALITSVKEAVDNSLSHLVPEDTKAIVAYLRTIPAISDPALPAPKDRESSTQAGFGKILNAIAGEDSELARRIVTTSPDVSVSTNLGAWINRRGLFGHTEAEDVFRELKVVSAQLWRKTPRGQHIELGIAENNLFIMLAALGLSHSVFGARLLPIGTVYDPFISRGLDALNYACYQDARFILAGTPAGITLAPEGGAHQSIYTPLIGMAADRLACFDPAYVDELAILLRYAFEHMQRPDGSAVWLRLSTRALEQKTRRLDPAAAQRYVDLQVTAEIKPTEATPKHLKRLELSCSPGIGSRGE